MDVQDRLVLVGELKLHHKVLNVLLLLLHGTDNHGMTGQLGR